MKVLLLNIWDLACLTTWERILPVRLPWRKCLILSHPLFKSFLRSLYFPIICPSLFLSPSSSTFSRLSIDYRYLSPFPHPSSYFSLSLSCLASVPVCLRPLAANSLYPPLVFFYAIIGRDTPSGASLRPCVRTCLVLNYRKLPYRYDLGLRRQCSLLGFLLN